MRRNPWKPHRKANRSKYTTRVTYPDALRQRFHVIIPELIGRVIMIMRNILNKLF
ncbi:Hypothetical protein GbCGDNIH9_8125 [Granulibacter bethesdensis]|uniref:Uncharacterized protein n=1 Tax=Granulibacter bethesdensis TaxID=364410 RepID=A0AAC9KB22_9PROT|nr:Hypothetical protein GbCGDNIH9_8125 [Granulibacter bethesdensis]APH62843.1 Hypothetical protein GbCGDNIH8_8674 [Granulibacter bethesdensis]